MANVKDKVVIVTGAGQGVGRGIALALAKEGAKVVIADVNLETAEATAQEIHQLGGEALALVCDVSKEAQVKKMVAEAVKKFGPVDVLVNNAQRVPPRLPAEDGTDEWWDACFETGPRATWYCCKAVFPHMKDRGGKIINLGSRAGIVGVGDPAYAGCKEAIRGFSRSIAREWGKYNITVNIMCPAAITPALEAWEKQYPDKAKKYLEDRPIPRWGDPEKDMGRTVVFLASSDADFITGQTIMVAGGDHMF
ncbi:SDR family NAD(P)-dependent oxidoreductase [Chloroflexota bacterium]